MLKALAMPSPPWLCEAADSCGVCSPVDHLNVKRAWRHSRGRGFPGLARLQANANFQSEAEACGLGEKLIVPRPRRCRSAFSSTGVYGLGLLQSRKQAYAEAVRRHSSDGVAACLLPSSTRNPNVSDCATGKSSQQHNQERWSSPLVP